MNLKNSLIFAVMLGSITAEFANIDAGEWVLNHAMTTIEVYSPVVKFVHHLKITSRASHQKSFIFAVDTEQAKYIAHISSEEEIGFEKISAEDFHSSVGMAWKVHFPRRYKTNEGSELKIFLYFPNMLKPFPEKINLGEKQSIIFAGNIGLLSPYVVKEQIVTLKLGKNNNVLQFNHATPTEKKGNSFHYGPFQLKPFSTIPAEVIFIMNAPILVAAEIEREIVISHWGRISVQDQVTMINRGAVLKGEYSRLGHMSNSAKSWTALLPAAATDLEYRDEIGLISSYAHKKLNDRMKVELKPRYPLVGGWKIQYEFRYNMPSFEYMTYSGEEFQLKMPFVDSLFESMIIDEFILKIVLPEGSTPLVVNMPDGMKKLNDSRKYSLLDTSGRNVLVFQKRNVVEASIAEFYVRYSLPMAELVRKPLLVISSLSFVLFAFIFSRRMALI